MNTKICVRRIGVLSLAKIAGAIYGLIGLLAGAIFSLVALLTSALSQAVGNSNLSAFPGMVFGAGAIVIFPILYGLIGFISGLCTGALYNVIAGMVGGIELEWTQVQG